MSNPKIINPDGAPVVNAVLSKPRRTASQAKGVMRLTDAAPLDRSSQDLGTVRQARLLKRKNRRTGTARLAGKTAAKTKGVSLRGRS